MRAVVVGLLLGLLAASTAPVLATSAAYQQGTTYYSQRKYDLAAKAYAEAARLEPGMPASYLAEANCLYMLNRRAEAANWYKTVLTRFPNAPEYQTALTYLKAIDPAAANSFGGGTETPSSKSTASTPAAVAGSDSTSSSTKAAAPFFKVQRPLGQHPYCSDDYIARIKGSLSLCPPKVVKYVAAKGCHITITPTYVDRFPESTNERPRGYEDGLTGKNVPACFYGGEVVVCQYILIGENDDEWKPHEDGVGSVRHEFGHAIDYYLGGISDTEEFRHIYYMDRGKMEPEEKQALNYFVQEGKSLEIGPSETFAEACCTIFGGRTYGPSVKRLQMFEKCFPNVISYVKRKLESI